MHCSFSFVEEVITEILAEQEAQPCTADLAPWGKTKAEVVKSSTATPHTEDALQS